MERNKKKTLQFTRYLKEKKKQPFQPYLDPTVRQLKEAVKDLCSVWCDRSM